MKFPGSASALARRIKKYGSTYGYVPSPVPRRYKKSSYKNSSTSYNTYANSYPYTHPQNQQEEVEILDINPYTKLSDFVGILAGVSGFIFLCSLLLWLSFNVFGGFIKLLSGEKDMLLFAIGNFFLKGMGYSIIPTIICGILVFLDENQARNKAIQAKRTEGSKRSDVSVQNSGVTDETHSSVKPAENHLDIGQINKVISRDEALTKDYNGPTHHNRLGDTYLKKGDQTNAIASFHIAAKLFQKEGQSLKALALYKKILNIDPSEAYALIAIGELNESKGLTTDAIKYYLASADTFSKKGKKDELLAVYDRILKLQPNANLRNHRNKLAESLGKTGESNP
jgi:tetratricopeptide (TPR) repeat protein